MSTFEIDRFRGRLMFLRIGRLVWMGRYPYRMGQRCVITGRVGHRRWAWLKFWRFGWIGDDGVEVFL